MYSMDCIVDAILWLYVQYGLKLWVQYCGCMYSMDCIVGAILWLYVQYGLYCG